MTHRHTTPPTPTLSAPSETTFGLLTSPDEGARAVTRTGTARRKGTDVHRSPSGSIAAHHALSAMSGHPLALEESSRAGSVAGGAPTAQSVQNQGCDTVTRDGASADAAPFLPPNLFGGSLAARLVGQSATQDRPGAPGASTVPSRGKYGNRRVSLDGHVFDSQAEGRRYLVLRHRQDVGEIAELEVHPTYRMEVNGVLIGKYSPDFAYIADGEVVIEDVKSKPTRTTAYMLRKKLMRAIYGFEIREVS